jgi:hypothetical protein
MANLYIDLKDRTASLKNYPSGGRYTLYSFPALAEKTLIMSLMIELAKSRYGDDIKPAGLRQSLNDCFTHSDDGKLVLWFNNASTGSTMCMYQRELSTLN